jgi:carbon starvation protein
LNGVNLLAIMLISAAALIVAYRVYGSLLARLLKLDDSRVTPAVSMRDDIDYQPIEPKFLMGQHFSAIAAAGPIVGPILAGVMFGWLPALIWIIVGSIFIGGVHDFTSLVASVRHKARSIAEVVKDHMSQRSYVLFLLFVWIALVYIIVAFTDIVADQFARALPLEDGVNLPAGAIATSSLLYLALPVAMGLLLRFTRMSLGLATVIFLPLVALAIWIGPKMPLDLAGWLGIETARAARIWGIVLLAYCVVASVMPLWMLLQPRGHLGGYFLYAALLAGALGIMVGSVTGAATINYDAFVGWVSSPIHNSQPLFPILFITIACGACSGFHCLIASGTTSKQLRRESDAKVIGYGAMLLEGMVAVVSLCCVMMLASDSPLATQAAPPAGVIYGQGIGRFLSIVGIPAALGITFGLLAFTTFIYDTLDVCTRLGRFIVQELTGMHNRTGRWLGTLITAAVPLAFLIQPTPIDALSGKPKPVWSVFWSLFGASNQLLAALALLGVTVWLWRTYRARWVWLITGLPALFMYLMSGWALLRFVRDGFINAQTGAWTFTSNPVPWVALVLIGLALLLAIEALLVFIRPLPPPAPRTPQPAAA